MGSTYKGAAQQRAGGPTSSKADLTAFPTSDAVATRFFGLSVQFATSLGGFCAREGFPGFWSNSAHFRRRAAALKRRFDRLPGFGGGWDPVFWTQRPILDLAGWFLSL